ncbi:MAG: hypothetical protein HZC47_06460 [Methanobacterium sp.]|uniref:hypothetical protein n=1 Tax=Methanobacterium sp. TaxID=2164 RepID=UPI003D64FD38|nr:hypothetical protein [Methanobacterium sp.]
MELNWVDLGSDIDTVWKNKREINFEEGINILALQPGAGKTTLIKEYLENAYDKKVLIIVPTHKLIETEYKEIIKNKRLIEHWKGFDYLCKKKNSSDPIFNFRGKNEENKITPQYICNKLCSKSEKKKCNYKKQFEPKEKHLTTVPEFLNLIFDRKEDYNFDMVFFDETFDRSDKLLFNEDVLSEVLEIIPICDIMQLLDGDERFINYLINDYRDALKEAVYNENEDIIKVLIQFNPYGFEKWMKYYKIYSEKRDYYEPYLYYAFKYALEGIPVVISDATFPEKFFTKVFEQFCSENDIEKENINFYGYKSSIKRKDKEIWKIYENNLFYKSYFGSEIFKLKEFVSRISRKYTNMGLITYKDYEDIFEGLKYIKETAHFYDTRGLNTFKNRDALLLLGTSSINEEGVLDDYNNIFRTNYSLIDDFWRPKFEKGYGSQILFDANGNKILKIKMKNEETGEIIEHEIILEEFERKMPLFLEPIIKEKLEIETNNYTPQDYGAEKRDSEIYQCIHRARPLINDNVSTFIAGYIPEDIIEFKIYHLPNEETDNFTSKWGMYPVAINDMINDFYDQKGYVEVLEVANELKIYKKGSKNPNTKFITAIRNTLEKDIKKIDAGIKKGFRNPSDFNKVDTQKNYSFKEFIEDFIYYAEEGDFL